MEVIIRRKLDNKRRVSIPVDICFTLGLKSEQEVDISINDNGEIVIRKAKEDK